MCIPATANAVLIGGGLPVGCARFARSTQGYAPFAATRLSKPTILDIRECENAQRPTWDGGGTFPWAQWPSRRSALPRRWRAFPQGQRRRPGGWPPHRQLRHFPRVTTAAKGHAALPHVGTLSDGRGGADGAAPSHGGMFHHGQQRRPGVWPP